METNVEPRSMAAGTASPKFRLPKVPSGFMTAVAVLAIPAFFVSVCVTLGRLEAVPYETMLERRLTGVTFEEDQPVQVWKSGDMAEVSVVLYAGQAEIPPSGKFAGQRGIQGRMLKISTPFASIMTVRDATHSVPWIEAEVDGEALTTSSLGARMHVDTKGVILHVTDPDQIRYHGR